MKIWLKMNRVSEMERHGQSHTSHDRGNLVEKINSLINCQVWTVDNLLATT